MRGSRFSPRAFSFCRSRRRCYGTVYSSVAQLSRALERLIGSGFFRLLFAAAARCVWLLR
jgi:hypothetical protein